MGRRVRRGAGKKMVQLRDDSFVEKIMYRLVRKHISGTTMSSALGRARELNSKKLHVSITFLSNGITTKSRAKYVTTTYLELIRQISRLGLKASVQAPLAQLGLTIDSATAAENLGEIIRTGNRHGVFVWAELPPGASLPAAELGSARGLGLAAPAAEIARLAREHRHVRAFKAIFGADDGKDVGEALLRQLKSMPGSSGNRALLSAPDGVVSRILNDGKQGRQMIFEFRLGESAKRMRRLARRGARMSVYLPFGKDWQAYAMTNVPEGYMRFIAGRLLGEAGSGGTGV